MMSGRGKAEAEEGGGEGNQLLVQRLQLHLMMKQWKWMIHSYRRHYHHSINNIHLISRRHSNSNNNNNKINSGCRRWCSNKRWNEISHPRLRRGNCPRYVRQLLWTRSNFRDTKAP